MFNESDQSHLNFILEIINVKNAELEISHY